jgi:hypothetical protein
MNVLPYWSDAVVRVVADRLRDRGRLFPMNADTVRSVLHEAEALPVDHPVVHCQHCPGRVRADERSFMCEACASKADTEVQELRDRVEHLEHALRWALTYISHDEPEDGEERENYTGAERVAWPDEPENWSPEIAAQPPGRCDLCSAVQENVCFDCGPGSGDPERIAAAERALERRLR